MSEQQESQPGVDWVSFVTKVGIPAAIALFLTYVLAGNVSAGINDVGRKLDAHINDMRVDQVQNRLILRQICLNVAKDEAQRAGCMASAEPIR